MNILKKLFSSSATTKNSSFFGKEFLRLELDLCTDDLLPNNLPPINRGFS